MTATYIALANVTLTGSDSSVEFSSIPTTYRDLVIVFVATGSIDENLTFTINGSTSDFTNVQMTSAPASSSGSTNTIGRVGTVQTMGKIEFFDYAQTNKHKSFLVRTNVTGSDARQLAARWGQTTAINSIALGIRLGGSFLTGSTFALYGIN